jgi:type II secretory pathway component GspD/PulD (secretin)
MNFGEVAAALGLLTPLVLGILAFYKDLKKRDEEKTAPPAKQEIVQGMPVNVDYVAELIQTLKKQVEEAEAEKETALRENEVLRAQVATYKDLDRR